MNLTLGKFPAESIGKVECDIMHFGQGVATIKSIRIHSPIAHSETPNAMLYPDGVPYTFPFLVRVGPEQIINDTITLDITGTIRYHDGIRLRDKDFARVFLRNADGDKFIIPRGPHNNERPVEEN